MNSADLIGKTQLMFELVHLAIQTDSTRLITMLLLGTSQVPPIPGVSLGHHDLSHHGRHLAFDPDNPPPLSNLYLSMLHRLGIHDRTFSECERRTPLIEVIKWVSLLNVSGSNRISPSGRLPPCYVVSFDCVLDF